MVNEVVMVVVVVAATDPVRVEAMALVVEPAPARTGKNNFVRGVLAGL
jgi:hypothetical protein